MKKNAIKDSIYTSMVMPASLTAYLKHLAATRSIIHGHTRWTDIVRSDLMEKYGEKVKLFAQEIEKNV